LQHEVPQASAPASFRECYSAKRADCKSRLAAGVLTSIVYALFSVLIWSSFLTLPVNPARPEIVAEVLPDVPKNRPPLPPPVAVHMIRPGIESIILPTFTVASAKYLAPELLPPTAAETAPIVAGGISGNGNGRGGHGGSAASTNTRDEAPVACLDPAWLHAITRRVMPFVNYPSAARRSHTTGVVILHFVVRRTGLLDLLEVSRSSGNQALDDAASEGMRLAQPLPPIPDHMHTDRIDEHYEVTFGTEPIPEKRALNLCEGAVRG
jgi:protein TonB